MILSRVVRGDVRERLMREFPDVRASRVDAEIVFWERVLGGSMQSEVTLATAVEQRARLGLSTGPDAAADGSTRPVSAD